jgi:hypothetical protein
MAELFMQDLDDGGSGGGGNGGDDPKALVQTLGSE